MTAKYYTILTKIGVALHANAQITQTTVPWTHMALGDGGGNPVTPKQEQTGLVHEVHRLPITAIEVHPDNPNWIVVEAVVPNSVGGWTVREAAILGTAGGAQCIAVGNYPDTYKPVLDEGAVREMVIRMIVEISSTATVNLVIDPAVAIASRDYVDGTIRAELEKRGCKQAVRAAATANIVLAGLQNIDDIDLAEGDRVLVKDQTVAKDNGIYVAAAGIWTRATDTDSAAKLNAGAIVPVTEGTLNADTLWTLRTDGAIVVGTTALDFQWLAGANAPNQPTTDNSAKVANTAFVSRAVAAVNAGHMFETSQWMGSRAAMPKGWFAMDGIQLSELLVPEIREALAAAGHEVVTEAVWQADPLQRGKWSDGGDGWVRMPDWNGATAGSIGGLYFGGDLGGGRHGTVVGDAIREISAKIASSSDGAYQFLGEGPFTEVSGAFEVEYRKGDSFADAGLGTDKAAALSFKASKVHPVADEVRPKSVYGTWIMRLYGSITNVGSLDAAALVAEINALKARASVLEARQLASGDGQTWTDVKDQRAWNTTYTNTSGRPIIVQVTSQDPAMGNVAIRLFVNAVQVFYAFGEISNIVTASAIVPAGAQYKAVRDDENDQIIGWVELI